MIVAINYHSILVIQFMILKIIPAEIPEIVTFNVKLSQDENVEVNLVPTESFLANENVPVWLTSDHSPDELQLVDGAMKDLGPLTIYRDPETCATAVYFHRRESFSGIIGHHHVIDNLPYNSRTRSVVPTDETVFPSLLEKHNERLPNHEFIRQLIGDEPMQWHDSLLPLPHTVYAEMLVIVNYDIFQKLNDYIECVSFVVKLFNDVDMMFSSIKKPNIKLNIAGIIIGTHRGSFHKLISESCYKRGSDQKDELDADCLLDSMRDTLHEYQTLPFSSYDIAIFLTGYRIFQIPEETSETDGSQTIREIIEGLTDMATSSYSYGLEKDDIILGVASFHSEESLLPVTAHEIAHMLGASHDGGPLFGNDRMCAAHLMKHRDHYCKRCFRFGGKTLDEFIQFLENPSSRQACIFHNKPRSLHFPRPVAFWNERDQCKCYGFPRALLNQPSHTPLHAVDCKSQLQCIAEDRQTHHTGLFMDGTPCDSERIGTKVCWNSECQTV